MLYGTAIRRCIRFFSLLFTLFIALLWTRLAQADTRVVDTLIDGNLTACTAAANDCTLRGAIHGAHDHDIITFDPSLAHQTLALSQGELLITHTLTLDGSTAPTVTISGNSASRVISTSQPLTVTNLIIQDGSIKSGNGGCIYAGRDLWLLGSQISNCVVNGFYPYGSGGGIFVAGNAKIEATIFLGNIAHIGGGVWVYGDVRLSDSTFISNTAIEQGGGIGVNGLANMVSTTFISNKSGQFGGGVFIFGSTSISSSSFLSNTTRGHGGGLFVENSTAMTATTFISNTAGHYGGGAFLFGPPNITETSFLTNAAEIGGGLYTESVATVMNTQFLDNRAELRGGGLFIGMICRVLCSSLNTHYVDQEFTRGTQQALLHNDELPSLTLINSNFYGNRADLAGGGADIDSPANVINTTFVNNSAKQAGGGLSTDGYITLTATTFFSNSTDGNGGGAHIYGSANMTDTTWISNLAGSTGGALYLYSEGVIPIKVVNSLFVRNRSIAKQGDAIYLLGPNSVTPYGFNHFISLHNTIATPIIASGSAIAIQMGIASITNTIITSHTVAIANFGGVTSENGNLFFGNGTNIIGIVESGGQSIEGDPAFVDSLHDDYHLTATSLAADRGVDLGVVTDFDGAERPQQAAPDIGAYESPYPRYDLPVAQNPIYLPLIKR